MFKSFLEWLFRKDNPPLCDEEHLGKYGHYVHCDKCHDAENCLGVQKRIRGFEETYKRRF